MACEWGCGLLAFIRREAKINNVVHLLSLPFRLGNIPVKRVLLASRVEQKTFDRVICIFVISRILVVFLLRWRIVVEVNSRA